MIKYKYQKMYNLRGEKKQHSGYYIVSYGTGNIIYNCTDKYVREFIIDGTTDGLGVANSEGSEYPYHINVDSSATGAVKFTKQITLEFTKGGTCYKTIPVEEMRKIHGTMNHCTYCAITVDEFDGTTIPPVFFCPHFGVMDAEGTIQGTQNVKSPIRMNGINSDSGSASFWNTNYVSSDELYPCPIISIGSDLTAPCDYDCKILIRALSWTENYVTGTDKYTKQHLGFQRVTFQLPYKLLKKDGVCDTLTVSDKEKRAYVTKRLQESDGTVSVLETPQIYELPYTPIQYFGTHSLVKTFAPNQSARPKVKIKFYSTEEQ